MWDVPSRPNDITNPHGEIQNLRKLWEANKWWWDTPERKAFLEALKKLTVENEGNKSRLITQINDEISAYTNAWDLKWAQKLEAFKKIVEEDYAKLIAEYEQEKRKGKLKAMNERAGLKAKVEEGDNNPRQAEALVAGLKLLAKDAPTVKALIELIENGPSPALSNDPSTGPIANPLRMSDMNLRWLVDHTLGGAYRSNGAYGPMESWTKENFMDFYNKNKAWLEPIMKEIQAFYNAWQTTEDWLLAKLSGSKTEKFELASFRTYLATYREGTDARFSKVEWGKSRRLDTDDRSFMTPYTQEELVDYFSRLDDATLVKRIKNIVELWGGKVGDGVTKPEDLSKYMKQNPMVRANYIRGLNLVASTPDRAEFFLAGKLVLGIVANKAAELVEKVKEKDMLERARAGLEKAADKNRDATEKNLALTPEQRKAILDGIDKFVTKMKSNEELKSVMLDGMLVLTNKWAAVWGGATMSLDTMLADTLSAGGSISTDYRWGFGAALSLAATKELYHSMKADFGVHYGIMVEKGGLSPFAGAHGTYEDFMAAVTKGPAFVNLFLGLKVGQNTEMIRNLQGLSSAQKEIYELAVKNNIATISVKNLVTDPAIAARMDWTIQSILTMNGFKSDLSNEVRYTMVYSAIVEAMNQEVLLLQRESNDNGWVMKQIGVNFGKVAGLAYILPGFGIGKDDLRVEIEEGKLQMKKTVALSGVDANKLLVDSGYTLTDSFDKVKAVKQFVITGKDKPVPTVVIDKELSGKVTQETANNIVTIKALRNVELVADRSVDGKITITVKDKGDFERTVIPGKKTEQLKGIDLTKDTNFEITMQTREARIALANAIFWGRNELTQFLAAYRYADVSNPKAFVETLLPSLTNLFKQNSKNKSIIELVASLSVKDQSPETLMSKIVRIRTGLMTDASNTEKLTITDGVANFSVKEGVKKNWESRKASKALIDLTGALDLSKFDGLMNTNETTYRAVSGMLGSVNTADLIWVVAGYKWGKEAHGFSVIPKGMMSVAQAGGKNLIEEISTTDATEKVTALGLISVYQPNMWKILKTNIETSVKKVTWADKIDIVDINTLLSTGKATINGKEVTSTAKFYRLAFGECLNTPSYGIDLWVVTSGTNTEEVKDGSSMRGSRVEQYEVANNRTRYGVDSKRINLLWGTIEDPKSEPPNPSTDPRVDPGPSVDTRPVADRWAAVPGAPVVTPSTGTAQNWQPINAPAGGGATAPRPWNAVAPAPTTSTQQPALNPVGSWPGVAPPPPNVAPEAVVPKVSAGTIAMGAEAIRDNPKR
jgi:hypothetical protein